MSIIVTAPIDFNPAVITRTVLGNLENQVNNANNT